MNYRSNIIDLPSNIDIDNPIVLISDDGRLSQPADNSETDHSHFMVGLQKHSFGGSESSERATMHQREALFASAQISKDVENDKNSNSLNNLSKKIGMVIETLKHFLHFSILCPNSFQQDYGIPINYSITSLSLT